MRTTASDILAKLIAMPTVTGDQVAMHELLNYVASFVSSRGMHVEWYESNGFESIVATTQRHHKKPKVLLAAHADVVPADDPAFQLTERDGRYYGRGVVDMKFAIATYMAIIDELGDTLDAYDIGLMITGDEEFGGLNGVAKLVQEGYLPEVCILPDGGDMWQVQTSSKGFWALEIAAEGRAAHGSRPWLGDNAIVKLTNVLTKVRQAFPDELTPMTDTISLNRINGGSAMNQVPEHASAVLDIRTMSVDSHSKVYDTVATVCQAEGVTLRVVSDCVPTAFSLDHPLIAPFAELVTRHTGVVQQGFHALGSSDVRFFAPYGVPCISVYPAGGNLHADNEWIRIQALSQFQTIVKEYLAMTAGVSTDPSATEVSDVD